MLQLLPRERYKGYKVGRTGSLPRATKLPVGIAALFALFAIQVNANSRDRTMCSHFRWLRSSFIDNLVSILVS